MKTVFVIGAGPAGMFAAQKIAQGGHEGVILTRDIKPGGLAERRISQDSIDASANIRKNWIFRPDVNSSGSSSDC